MTKFLSLWPCTNDGVPAPANRPLWFSPRVWRAGVICTALASAHCSGGSGEEAAGQGASKASSTTSAEGTATEGTSVSGSTSSGGASSMGSAMGSTSSANAGIGGSGTVGTVDGVAGSSTSMGGSGMGGASTTDSGQGGNTGGDSTASGGSAGSGGSGGTPPVCPKPDGEICHEFFASDNSRHEIIYVNEFDPSKNWSQPTQNTASGNSPRQLEVVENSAGTDGRAIMVSVESGYEEYDYVTHALLNSVDLGNISVRGAARLPDGNTVLGVGDATLRVVTPEGSSVGECNLPGSGADTLRILSRDPASGFIYYGRLLDIFAVDIDCQQEWTATFPDSSSKAYRVLAREGGGAWAATGYPASVVEIDASGQVVSEVGGLGEFPGVMDFSSGFELTSSGNVVIANWWGHVVPPPQEGPHIVEFTPANQIVWTWGTQAEAVQITNVLVVQ